MSTESLEAVLEGLLRVNLATAAGVLIVLAVRPLVLKHLGARAAYLCWTLVPALMLAFLIPARAIEVVAPAVRLPTGLEEAGASSARHAAPIDWLALATPITAVWLTGMIGMGVLLALRQRRFLIDMSVGMAGPAVVGFRRPRIVTPDDFATRFSPAEQRLILAHEEIHLERQDARINALAALARCVCWFNPLVHLGAHVMRIDQELSCDAAVIERRPRTRRAYAETLLKSQLAFRPLPVGCYWPAPSSANGTIHPLTERIDMLTRKPVSQRRRLAATAAVLALAAGAGATAWAAQPERRIASTIALPPVVEGEAPEVLLPLQPVVKPHASPRTDVRLAPDEPPASAITDTKPKVRLDGPVPQYPAESRSLHEEGMVTLELCVSKTGAVESAKLLQSSGHPALDEATLAWVAKETLYPAIHNGQPVAVCNYPLAYQWILPNEAPQPPPG